MYLDVLDNKPEQPEGRLVVFMPMNEAATVVYSTAVWWVYSVQSSAATLKKRKSTFLRVGDANQPFLGLTQATKKTQINLF